MQQHTENDFSIGVAPCIIFELKLSYLVRVSLVQTWQDALNKMCSPSTHNDIKHIFTNESHELNQLTKYSQCLEHISLGSLA